MKISKTFLAAMFSAAIGLSTPSYGQSSSEIESAVRAGRRAADEYRRQEQDSKDSTNQALYEKNMAEIRVLEKNLSSNVASITINSPRIHRNIYEKEVRTSSDIESLFRKRNMDE
ncbi:hypothetical protein [Sphingomonas sp. Ant20]|uniref:hypothetical protein n=1 Tax=Sphingomonas sp. Ant20 TaxID=104605 RepID=UPI000FE13F7D|nr:hypothetical protein [Sphingomonas sp. Ant20]